MKPSPAIASNHSPFGTVLQGRSWSSESYRYGFNGKEKEELHSSDGNYDNSSYDFGARIYDGRLGRWLSVDPLHQFASPYLGMGNVPISGVDPDGRWFFGLFGSTTEQRQAARKLRDERGGGTIKDWASKDIHWSSDESTPQLVDINSISGESDVTITGWRDAYFDRDGNKQTKPQHYLQTEEEDQESKDSSESSDNILFTANFSMWSGGAATFEGIGGAYNHAGVVVLGFKDNQFYAIGNNNSTGQREVFSNASLGCFFIEGSKESKKIGSRSAPVVETTETIKMFGILYLEQFHDLTTGKQKSTWGLDLSTQFGLVGVVDAGLKIPLYEE